MLEVVEKIKARDKCKMPLIISKQGHHRMKTGVLIRRQGICEKLVLPGSSFSVTLIWLN